MDYNYPLLQKVFDHYYRSDLNTKDIRLYSCMHLLEPQLKMYRLFIDFGLQPSNITALGKIYSSNKEIIEEMKALGIATIQPEFNPRSFDLEHAENCRVIAEQIQENCTNIILDDGAYLIYGARKRNITFAVEQTSSGFRKLESEQIDFPIFNVARSKTKLTQESPIVARDIFERVTEYIVAKGIRSPKILVMGLGPIGEAVYEIFKKNLFTVDGLDITTSRHNFIAHIKDKKPDVIIGATGNQLLQPEDLQHLEGEHVFYFISVSSSDREFPVCSYRQGEIVHSDVRHKNFIFVNNGFPISFRGNRNELTPMEIEKTIALLMGSVFHGIVHNVEKGNGFIDIPDELHDLINS